MNFNSATQKRGTTWLLFLPLLVVLYSFSGYNNQSKTEERLPTQTELRLSSARSNTAFHIYQNHAKLSQHHVRQSFTNSLRCYAHAVSVQLTSRAQRFSIKIQSRSLALIYTARNTGDIILSGI